MQKAMRKRKIESTLRLYLCILLFLG